MLATTPQSAVAYVEPQMVALEAPRTVEPTKAPLMEDLEPYGTTTIRNYIIRQAELNNVPVEEALKIVACESQFVSQQSRHIQRDGTRERSYGVWQINLDYNPVTLEQASSTIYSTGWAMQRLKEGKHYLWSCWPGR